MCKASDNIHLELNIMNKTLPHVTLNNRKWLIDTGSEYNYVNPDIIPDKITKYNERFTVKTPTGSKQGSHYIYINTTNHFKQKSYMKAYVFKFSEKYDILLGHKTLQEHGMNINFKTNTLESNLIKIPIESDSRIPLESGINVIEYPTRLKNSEVYIPEQDKGQYKILEGLYSVKNGKIKLLIESHDSFFISVEDMEIDDEFEIKSRNNVISDQDKLEEIRNEIPNLIRTSHMNEEERTKIIELLKQYPNVVKREDDPLTATNLLKHNIKTKTDEPIYSRNYRYPQCFREDVKLEIDKLLKNKIIRPSNSPYNSPIWIVPKKMDASGKRKIRMVCDYRKLNEQTIDDRFPLPNIEDLFGKIGRATYFSAMDLASGFHQIEMEESSIPKTAFSTESGHYEYLRMPFGLKNAPPTFQRAMNILFSHLPNVLVYMDDIIIFSDNLTEHLKHIRSVLDTLKKHQLQIQLDKTEFFKKELLFLGHIISKDGIRPNPSKLEAIKKFPIPTTTKQVKQFLGLTGYYRKMIRNYAKIAKPMTAMLRSDNKIDPTNKEYVDAFNTLKSLLLNDPILQLPDFNKDFCITCDASNFAIGAVLSQNFNGKDLPISYASRTLNKHEENLSTIEKELLAIVWACKYFRPYIYGRKITILSDHKPLQYLHNMKTPNSKMLRWKCQLSDYDINIKYITGKSNVVADALSRNPHDVNVTEQVDPDKELDAWLKDCDDVPIPQDFDVQDLSNALNLGIDDNASLATQHSQESSNNQCWIVEDPNKSVNLENNQIIINRGNPNTNFVETLHGNKKRLHLFTNYPVNNDLRDSCLEYLKPNTTYGVYCSNQSLQIKNELLEKIYTQFQKIIEDQFPTIKIKRYLKLVKDIENPEEQKEIIINQHEGKTCHRGINDVYFNIRNKYYWPRMITHITEYINNCHVCKTVKYDRNPPRPKFQVTPTPTKPFESIQIDVFFFENRKILTIIDMFSKKLYGYMLKSTTGQEIIKCLRHYFRNFPIPQLVQCDNGPEFSNKGLDNFLSYHNTNIHFTTPNYSNSNGLINRAHNTLIELMNIIKQEKLPDCIPIDDVLELAIIAYNNTPNSTIKLTPNEITFGKIDNEYSPILLETQVENYHKEKELINQSVRKIIEKEKENRTNTLNKNREDIIIPDGNIYIKTHNRLKNKPRYKAAKYSKAANNIINKGKATKIHPSQIKRPRKLEKNNLRSVSQVTKDGPNTSIASPANLPSSNNVQADRPN